MFWSNSVLHGRTLIIGDYLIAFDFSRYLKSQIFNSERQVAIHTFFILSAEKPDRSGLGGGWILSIACGQWCFTADVLVLLVFRTHHRWSLYSSVPEG